MSDLQQLPVPHAGETVNQYVNRLNASGFGPQIPVLGDSYDTPGYYRRLARQLGQSPGLVPITYETMLRTADPDLLPGVVRNFFPQGLTPSQDHLSDEDSAAGDFLFRVLSDAPAGRDRQPSSLPEPGRSSTWTHSDRRDRPQW